MMMMRTTLIAAALLSLVAGPLWAVEESHPNTVAVPCTPLVDLKGGPWRQVTHDEWVALRVTFRLNPNTPDAFPPGDSAIISDPSSDGKALILFVDSDQVCAPFTFLKEGVAMLKEVREGTLTHPVGGL